MPTLPSAATLFDALGKELNQTTPTATTIVRATTAQNAFKTIAADDESTVNILDYIQASWGPGMRDRKGNSRIYPVQKFLLKCLYKLPLDDITKDIEIWDETRENILDTHTELSFLKFLHDEGRTNLTYADILDPNKHFPTVVLILGRRGTKSTTCSWVAGYELYKLLRLRDPQEYYGISPDQDIGMITVSTGKDQSGELFQTMANTLERSTFFKPYINAALKRSVHITTRIALENDLSGRTGISIRAAACSARSLRGPQRILGILDEYGHFSVELAAQDKSDKSIWDALYPSISDMTHPDGSPAGKMFVISSPLSRESHLYQLKEQALAGVPGIMYFGMPSVWINKRINVYILRQEYEANREKALQEYGAQFSDKVSAAFKNVDLKANIRKGPTIIVRKSYTAFMGIDIGGLGKGTAKKGGKGDGCAWHIGYIEGNKHISMYHEYMDPERRNVEFPLTFERITDHTIKLWNEFKPTFGIYDQFEGYGMQAILRMKGMPEWSGLKSDVMRGLYMVRFTDRLNSDMWKYAIHIAEAGQVELYDDTPEGDFIKEMYSLQAYQTSKDMIKVECPGLAHQHDDRGDAWARWVYAAKMYYDEHPNKLSMSTRNTGRVADQERGALMKQAVAMRRRAMFSPRTGNSEMQDKLSMMQRMRRVQPRPGKGFSQ